MADRWVAGNSGPDYKPPRYTWVCKPPTTRAGLAAEHEKCTGYVTPQPGQLRAECQCDCHADRKRNLAAHEAFLNQWGWRR